MDAIETTLGWDTIYEPEKRRVISPVSRVWSVGWGGYVLFDWDTFFAATLASVGDKRPGLCERAGDLARGDGARVCAELCAGRGMEERGPERAAGGSDHGAGAVQEVS